MCLLTEMCVALYTYMSTVAEDLTFNKGDVITVVKEDGEWWTGSKDGRTGTFPANYVKKLAPAAKVTVMPHLHLMQTQVVYICIACHRLHVFCIGDNIVVKARFPLPKFPARVHGPS